MLQRCLDYPLSVPVEARGAFPELALRQVRQAVRRSIKSATKRARMMSVAARRAAFTTSASALPGC